MPNKELSLIAHLFRRAGFGATRDELEYYVGKGYEATVEELLNIEHSDPADEYVLARYQPGSVYVGEQLPGGPVWWMYHMVNTHRPLEEKMTLFWHQLFATGVAKIIVYDELVAMITRFRHNAMGILGIYYLM